MADLGRYALEVGLAYGVSLVLIAALVAATLARGRSVRRALTEAEGRRGGGPRA